MHAKRLQSCLTLQSHGLRPTRLLCPWDSPGRNTGEGCHFFLHVVFPTQDGAHVFYVSCLGRQVLFRWCHLGRSGGPLHSEVLPVLDVHLPLQDPVFAETPEAGSHRCGQTGASTRDHRAAEAEVSPRPWSGL